MPIKHLVISKASPIGDQHVSDAMIEIRGEVPKFKSLQEAAEFYDRDAFELANLLASSLPGGTLDRLTACLLTHQATLLRVLH